MTYEEFLAEVVRRGIEDAKRDYADPKDKSRLEGSIDGFEACRQKSPAEISKLLAEALQKTTRAFRQVGQKQVTSDEYWWICHRGVQIEWVANVLSAFIPNLGFEAIIDATVRGALMADVILKEAKEKKP
jgi:hypothetical protein